MKNLPALLGTTLLLLSSAALAQPSDGGFDHPMPALHDALEIAIGGGYMQGLGDTGAGVDVEDVAGPGGNGELQIGYRISPHLAIGAYGTLEGFAAGNRLNERRNDVVGASVGLKTDWHLRPNRSVDPWISTGGGMRWLWIDENNTSTTTLRGLDLARLQVGVDYRVTPTFALSPVIGATATMYLDADTPMTDGFRELDDKQISWTFSGGLLGRFDLK
jgi:hypothetical protein